MEDVVSLECFVRGHVFHVNIASSVKDEYKGLIVTS